MHPLQHYWGSNEKLRVSAVLPVGDPTERTWARGSFSLWAQEDLVPSRWQTPNGSGLQWCRCPSPS